MSKRTPSVAIGDILQCIDHIESYTAKLSFEDFSTNFMVLEACLYNIQIIGEAVNQLADDVKAENPQVPWILIKGMRNRLIHEYFGTDLSLVWNVITGDLPEFKEALKIIQNKLQNENR
jgi:uncharacterized protein with HEPN domain